MATTSNTTQCDNQSVSKDSVVLGQPGINPVPGEGVIAKGFDGRDLMQVNVLDVRLQEGIVTLKFEVSGQEITRFITPTTLLDMVRFYYEHHTVIDAKIGGRFQDYLSGNS